ncbi:GbsR/MarR family transcriptional regulator [Nocardia crassostreae]|uniref:GbsR/MarR family transcriptional regulator n=1 Tax=Nocardia crassostreae TaxID=53428 RepID=UPI0008339435|nr:MarR family transcriptional regulator [Nocardia crassostreae]
MTSATPEPSSAAESTAPTEAQLAFVEDFALVLERMGLVRMVGRTVGWLLVSNPPQQTFNQIAEALQASKGSISSSLKTLTTMRWVEKTTKPGDRRDYYTVRPGILPELSRQQSGMYDNLTETTSRGLALFDDPNGPDAARVRDMHDFFVWMGKEFPALLDRWDAERGK